MSRSPRSTFPSRPSDQPCSRTSETKSDLSYVFIAHDLSVVSTERSRRRHVPPVFAEVGPSDELYVLSRTTPTPPRFMA